MCVVLLNGGQILRVWNQYLTVFASFGHGKIENSWFLPRSERKGPIEPSYATRALIPSLLSLRDLSLLAGTCTGGAISRVSRKRRVAVPGHEDTLVGCQGQKCQPDSDAVLGMASSVREGRGMTKGLTKVVTRDGHIPSV